MTEKTTNDIIESLIENTLSGSLKWSLRDTIFNKDTSKYYEVYSIDGKTRFQIEVSTDNVFNYKKTHNALVFFNTGLVDGTKYNYPDKFPLVHDLQKVPSLPVNNEESTLGDILSSIGDKQMIRDKKIDSILSEKGKSILGRLFG